MKLREKAIKEARKMLSNDIDFQLVIETLFNDRDEYDALFAGMDDDERFEEAQDIITEAS